MKKTVLVMVVCIFLDQIFKYLAYNFIAVGESIEVIKNFFNITLVMNPGAAFSMFSSSLILLIIISFIVLAILFRYIYKSKLSNFEYIIYGVLCGGIIGNLLDRIIHGMVIDYLDFKIFGYNFPIFNFADICIVVSIFLIIILTFKDGKNEVSS